MRASLGSLRHRVSHWLVTASVTLMGVTAIGAGVMIGVTTAPPAGVRPGAVTPAGQGVSVTPTRPAGTTPAATEPLSTGDVLVLAPVITAATATQAKTAAQAPDAGSTTAVAPEAPSVTPRSATPVEQVVQPVLGVVDGLGTATGVPASAATPR